MKVVFVSSVYKYFYSCWFHFRNTPSVFYIVLTCLMYRICQTYRRWRCRCRPCLSLKSWNLERSLTSLMFVPVTLHTVTCISISFLPDQTKSLIGGLRGVFISLWEIWNIRIGERLQLMDTLHAVHRRRRSCIMELYSHYNRYYVLLCRQEKTSR